MTATVEIRDNSSDFARRAAMTEAELAAEAEAVRAVQEYRRDERRQAVLKEMDKRLDPLVKAGDREAYASVLAEYGFVRVTA